MNNLNYLLVILFLAIALWSPTEIAAKTKSSSHESRSAAALAASKSNPNIVSVYARGACCPSCAIGVRIKISKLEFVDQKRFSKGVKLDARHELVHIGIKPDHTAQIGAIAQAIVDAGYDPVHAYELVGGKLVTTSLTQR